MDYLKRDVYAVILTLPTYVASALFLILGKTMQLLAFFHFEFYEALQDAEMNILTAILWIIYVPLSYLLLNLIAVVFNYSSLLIYLVGMILSFPTSFVQGLMEVIKKKRSRDS